MKRHIAQLLATVTLTAFLAACGGGGTKTAPPPTTGTKSPAVKKSSTVSGTVALVSLNSLVAKRTQKVSVRKAAGQDAAQISIRSYTKSNVELGKYTITTGATGAFAQDIDLDDAGGYVVITATKAGYADFSKRIDYDKPSALNLRAELAKVTTGTGTTNTATNSIDIGVVRNIATGAKSVYSGTALKSARKAAGNQVELEMKLNTANLPGTTSVIGQFETFNATDPTQAQYFPGAYRGTDTSAGKTGQLVSMAFDYINLTTNQGKDVFKEVKKLAKAGKIRKAADNPVQKVTRWVPTSSCENLFMQDGTPGNSVWDVPIWSVDPYAGDGTWLKIGDGVVVSYNSTSGGYDPIAIAGTSSTAAISAAKTACSTTGYYVEITVTNPLYLEKWWNLDHIILSATTPQDVCVSGKILDNNGMPLTDLWLYMYDEDYDYPANGNSVLRTNEDGTQTFDYSDGVTSSTGAFSLKATLFNNADTDRTATISYYDPITYDYKEQIVTVGNYDSVSKSCPTTAPTITVTRPAVCTVNGTVSGTSISGEMIEFYNGGKDYFYDYTYSDENGKFTAQVPCGREIEVSVGYNWSSAAIFNVNGVTTGHTDFELTDTGSGGAGSIVTLKPLTKANTPPEVWGYLDTYYATTGQAVSAAVYVYDYDGDYPVSYSISYTGATGNPVQVASGTITSAQVDSGVVTVPLQTASLVAGSYNLNITATDSKGNSSAESPVGSLLIYSGSAGSYAPSVWLYSDQNTINTSDLGTALMPLYAVASDINGASTLSYTWKVKYNGVDVTSPVGGGINFNPVNDVISWSSEGSATPTFTPPVTVNTSTTVGNGGIFTVEVSVSDGTNTSMQSIDLRVGTAITYPGTITIQKPVLYKRR